jgi:hypothetical protein
MSAEVKARIDELWPSLGLGEMPGGTNSGRGTGSGADGRGADTDGAAPAGS